MEEKDKDLCACAHKNDQLPTDLVDVFLGAWVAGLGFTMLMLGLSVWAKATMEWSPDECCRQDAEE